MRKIAVGIAAAAAIIALINPAGALVAQESVLRPVTLEQEMPDFSLPSLQGGRVSLSGLRGRNVLLIFPRGYAAEGRWCTICNYKYAELVDLEAKEQIRRKLNTEILIVLPYSENVVRQWLDSHPAQLRKVRTWKNPPDPEKLDEKGKAAAERYRKLFPKDLSMEEGAVPTPFPILIDAERRVTGGLGIFATEWSGSKVDQVIPSVYVIDKDGILRFKYISQNTADRPSYEYLIRIIQNLGS